MALSQNNIKNLITTFIISINSGLAYALLTSTFVTYLFDNGIDIALIGLLSLRNLPYSFRYFIAPLVDNIKLKFLPKKFGQLKSWMLFTQFALVILLYILSLVDASNIEIIILLAFFIAVFAATYDVSMEAYRTALFKLKDKQFENSIACNIFGFRIGLIISGTGALYLSSKFQWHDIFQTLSILMVLSFIGLLFIDHSPSIKSTTNKKKPKRFIIHYLTPIKTIFSSVSLPTLILIAFFKISDSFLDEMMIPFLIEVGFNKAEIASVYSFQRIIAASLGVIFGTYLLNRMKSIKILFFAELSCAITNTLFISFIYYGNNIMLFTSIMFLESLFSGFSNVCLISLTTRTCLKIKDKYYMASYIALMFSLSSLSRVLFSSFSGIFAETFGWANFFIFSSLLSIPALICILLSKKDKLIKVDKRLI